MRLSTMTHNARLASRLPPRLRRWAGWWAGRRARTPASRYSHPSMCTQYTQRLAQFVGGSVQYGTQLIGGLGAHLYRRAPGEPQHTDRLNGAVSLLGYPQRLTREHRPGG